MKKMIFVLGLVLFFSAGTMAQTKEKVETEHSKVKAKPKTTPKQKVHNVIHPKRKETSGEKVKGKKD